MVAVEAARRAGVWVSLLFAVLAAASIQTQAMAAYVPPNGTVEYQIEHSKYGVIGTHVVSFSQSGDELVVSVVIQNRVKILFVTVHSMESDRREVWRNGRMVAYRSHTDENSKITEVSARIEGDKLVIAGENGTVSADGEVFPSHPWNPAIVDSSLWMETQTGQLLHVKTVAEGGESIDVAGTPVQTKKYRVSGDIEREIWFDGSGNWIRLRFRKDGATVTLTRTTPMP